MKTELLTGSRPTDWDSSSVGHGPAQVGGEREGGWMGGCVSVSSSVSSVVSITIALVNRSSTLTFCCIRPHLGRLLGC